MAKAAPRADSPSATTTAVQVNETRNTHTLYGTDRAAAQRMIDAAEKYTNTEIDRVKISRYGGDLLIEIIGRVAISTQSITRRLPEGYELDGLISHSSGSATVQLRHTTDT